MLRRDAFATIQMTFAEFNETHSQEKSELRQFVRENFMLTLAKVAHLQHQLNRSNNGSISWRRRHLMPNSNH